MFTIDMINVIIESCGILMCILGATYAFIIGARMERKTSRFMVALFVCIGANIASNMIGIFLRGVPGTSTHIMLRVANFMEYFCGYSLAIIMSAYLLMRLDKLNTRNHALRAVLTFYAVSVVLLIVSQFNNMYYYVDENNIYQRGRLFWLSQMMAIATLILDIVVFWPNRMKLPKRERMAFVMYVILPVMGMILQIFSYGLFTLLYADTIAAIIMFVCIMMDQVERYCHSERAVAEMQYQIMMSQIRPHFLFNSLTSIAQLCVKDPARAQKATLDFAEYLRGNMAALRDSHNIPFNDELRHVKTYLSLEKMRYDDSLNVEYDINTTDFLLPALSIQPLVENAVKHGVGMKDEGGTVKISTHEYPDRIEVKVMDDGVGFDTSVLDNPDKRSIGIFNVRRRLSERRCGSLVINSTPGVGTTACVILPRDVDMGLLDDE